MSSDAENISVAQTQSIFEKVGLETIERYDRLWARAAAENRKGKAYFELLRQRLREATPHVHLASREAEELLKSTALAEYEDRLAELDRSLAHREINFCRILLAAIIESYRIARLERAKGRVGDLKVTLGCELIFRSCLTVNQLAGSGDYLISTRESTPITHGSSSVANEMARATLAMTRQLRRRAIGHFGRLLPRYAFDVIRRNWVQFFVGMVVCGWLLSILSDWAKVSAATINGFLIAIVGWILPLVFEKLRKRKWLELHRNAIQSGVTTLYLSFEKFLPERSILDSLHELTDDRKLR